MRMKGVSEVYDFEIDRADPILVKIVEELGESASGTYADIKIAEVPKGSRYHIDEYDGNEIVMTIEDYDWHVADW